MRAARHRFQYPVGTDALIAFCGERSGAGLSVGFLPWLLNGEDARPAPVACLWFGSEGAAIPSAIRLTAVVETCPGEFALYLRVREPVPWAEAARLNLELSDRTSGGLAARAALLPGARNFSRAGAPVVRLLHAHPSLSHDARDIEAGVYWTRGLPRLESPAQERYALYVALEVAAELAGGTGISAARRLEYVCARLWLAGLYPNDMARVLERFDEESGLRVHAGAADAAMRYRAAVWKLTSGIALRPGIVAEGQQRLRIAWTDDTEQPSDV